MIHSITVPRPAAFAEQVDYRHALAVLFLRDEFDVPGRHRCVNPTQPLQHFVFALTAQYQKLQGFRQQENHQHGNHQRHDAAEDKNRAPPEPRNQPGRDKPADGRSHREEIRDQHHHGHANPRRTVLACQSHGIGHDAAQPKARDEADRQQLPSPSWPWQSTT